MRQMRQTAYFLNLGFDPAFGVVSEWAVRPQAISLLMLATCVSLVAKNRVAWLPFVCVLWSNTHGVVLLGIVVAGCAALESLIWSRARLPRDILIAAACIVAPTLTPLGFNYWPQVKNTVFVSQAIGIHEFRSAFEMTQVPFWIMVGMLAVLTIRQHRELFRRERADRFLWLVSCVLAVAGALAVRNIPFFVLVAAPALSRLLPTRAQLSHVGTSRHQYVLALVTAVIAIGVIGYRWRDGGRALGWKAMSPAVADAIRVCDEPIFNGFAAGGPILWFVPERKVFIDSRVTPYPIELLAESRRADLYGDFGNLFSKYAFRCAVVETGSKASLKLASDFSMSRSFIDNQWTVYIPRPAGMETRMNTNEFVPLGGTRRNDSTMPVGREFNNVP